MTIPIPEPVAVAFLAECGNVAYTGHLEGPYRQLRALSADGRRGASLGLITTEQAEAYAAAKVREALEWQPIETAPQDGTPVLLFARLESAEASTRVVGSFILGEWLAQSYVGQNKAVLVPSHWMPLPPFPPLPGPVEP